MRWEEIEMDKTRGARSDRLRVPGGWIVRTIYYKYDAGSVSQVFVPDAGHKWRL